MINLSFFAQKEKFLVLEISPTQTSGFLFSLDCEKNIKLEKQWPVFRWERLPRRLRHHLEKWKVIVATDSALATTAILPISLEREPETSHQPLSHAELENLLTQAIAKIFIQCRGEASRELNVEELDTILIDNRVTNFKVDHHHVINPIEFKAKKIEAVLELTLTSRSVFDNWKNSFSIGETRNFFFTETARAQLFILKRVKELPLNLAILSDENSSFIFTLEKAAIGETVRRYRIKWSPQSLLDTIGTNFGVSQMVAEKLYHLYLKNEVSPRISRHFNFILKPIIAPLLNQFENLKIKGPTYLTSNLELPLFFPKKLGKINFYCPSADEIVDKLGFKVDLENWPWSGNQTFKHIAPLLEFYYNNEDLAINRWLRRRLHWLGSTR